MFTTSKAEKVQGIRGIHRQPRGGDIEQVGKAASRIGNALAHALAAFDQYDVGRNSRGSTQQLHCQHRSREPPADYDNGVLHP